MIAGSTDHLVCEHYTGCFWRVVWAGPKRFQGGIVRAARAKSPDKTYCRAYSLGKGCGDLIRLSEITDCAGVAG